METVMQCSAYYRDGEGGREEGWGLECEAGEVGDGDAADGKRHEKARECRIPELRQ